MDRKLCGLFAVDSRSLAAFRIAIGVIFFVDVAIRAGDFAAHYSESGVLPLAALKETLGANSWRWSVYVWNPAVWWPALLMGISALSSVLMTVGLMSRLATIAVWVLALSVHNRMPVVINAGDTLLHVLLFWGMFLPLGATWSIDAWRRRNSDSGHPRAPAATVCDIATTAILLQMALLYVCAGIFKLFNEDWLSGMSLYYVMSYDAYARPAAAWMLEHPKLLQTLTWATVALEIAGPLLAFSPWKRDALRLLVIASFMAFHLGIELTMTVGLFSWVSMAGWLLYVPGSIWDALTRGIGRAARSPLRPRGATRHADAAPGGVSRLSRVARLKGGLRSLAQRPAQGVVLAMLVLTVYWNICSFNDFLRQGRLHWMGPVMELTGLKQQWRMFTRPPKRDGWPRVVATLTDGREWDLLEERAGFDWQRRELPSAIAPNHRWRKYYAVLIGKRFEHLQPYFCRYLARRFEKAHPEKIHSVSLYQVQEITGKPGEEPQIIRRLLHHEEVRPQGAFLDAVREEQGDAPKIHPGL